MPGSLETHTRHWPGAGDTVVTETEAALPWEVRKKTELVGQLDSASKRGGGRSLPRWRQGSWEEKGSSLAGEAVAQIRQSGCVRGHGVGVAGAGKTGAGLRDFVQRAVKCLPGVLSSHLCLTKKPHGSRYREQIRDFSGGWVHLNSKR